MDAHLRWWEEPPRPALLLLAGAALGPQGLGVFHGAAIALLDPAIPVAIAAIGVLVTFRSTRRALLTDAVIILAAALVLLIADPSIDLLTLAARLWRAVQACGAAILAGVAGVLLLSRAASGTERRVFGLGLLLLLGGITDFASAPSLIAGVIAATLWRRLAAAESESIRRDVEYLHHALAAFFLVMIGAQIEVSLLVTAIGAIYLLLLLLIARLAPVRARTPGVVAVAIAVDAARTLGLSFVPLISAIAIATIAAQLVMSLRNAERAPAMADAGAAA